jgi:hypothetical protein
MPAAPALRRIERHAAEALRKGGGILRNGETVDDVPDVTDDLGVMAWRGRPAPTERLDLLALDAADDARTGQHHLMRPLSIETSR